MEIMCYFVINFENRKCKRKTFSETKQTVKFLSHEELVPFMQFYTNHDTDKHKHDQKDTK